MRAQPVDGGVSGSAGVIAAAWVVVGLSLSVGFVGVTIPLVSILQKRGDFHG